MPPQTQRRRRTGNHVDSEDEGQTQRRRSRQERDYDSEDPDDADEDGDGDANMGGVNEEQQLVKKLVRYALACEYARIPIKRDGIRDKVLGNNSRSFKQVFDAAQKQLRDVFGMEMIELPVREKRTLKDKQKATVKKANSQSATSRQYILTSILPEKFKTPTIIQPSRIPSSGDEGAYAGFYTMVICLIVLTNGELSDMKLKRHLRRMNAEHNLPMDTTENVLAKMVRQGYVEKVIEKSEQGEDDTVTWCVGPRGKVELLPEALRRFILEVWGQVPDDFEKKLRKSLGLPDDQELEEENGVEEAAADED